MFSHNATENILALLLDADGSYYNSEFYIKRLIYVTAEYGVEILHHATKLKAAKEDERENVLKSIQDFFEKMLTKLEKLDISAYDDREMRLQVENTFVSDNAAEKFQAYNYQSNNVANAIRTIYPKFFDRLGIMSNSKLIQYVLECQHDFDTLILAISSNRQSPEVEFNGMIRNRTGKFTHDIGILAAHLAPLLPNKKIIVEKVNLTDIADNKPLGSTFEEMRVVTSILYQPTNYQYDKSKFMLLYLLIHHIAYNNIKHKVAFKMLDDLDIEILKPLEAVITNLPTLLPRVPLELVHYDGTIKKTIKMAGEGTVDENYQDNTRLIARKIFPNPDKLSIHIHPGVSDFLQERENKTFKKNI